MQPSERPRAQRINMLSNKIRRRIDALSAGADFSGAEGKALHFILAQTDDVFQRDLEEEFSLRPPTATELLKKMERRGLIRREPHPQDARLKRIVATDKALGYRETVFQSLASLESSLLSGISAEELAAFDRVLEHMLENLA